MSRIALRSLVAVGALAAVLVPITPAAAGEVLVVEEPWRETVRCGDVVGVASGTVVQHIHLYPRGDGSVGFVLTERVEDSTFVAAGGDTYRVTGAGAARGQAEPEMVVDHQVLHLVFVDPSGLLGSLHERYDGTTRTVTGGCTFADDEELAEQQP